MSGTACSESCLGVITHQGEDTTWVVQPALSPA